MNKYLIASLSFLFGLSAHAQSSLQEINTIKKSKRYVYAVAASTQSKEDAAVRAKDLLLLEVEQWLKDEKENDFEGYVVKVKNNTSQIETQRGKLYRVFVYVAKKDVLPYYKDEEIETVKKGGAKADTVSITQQSSSVSSEPKVEQPEQAVQQEQQVQTDQQTQPQAAAVTLTAEEKQMLPINKFTDLISYIKEKEADGTIVKYGKYLTMPTDVDVYVFVYNRQGGICAKIKKFGGKSLNMETLQQDDVASYKGCGAMWIKMKE